MPVILPNWHPLLVHFPIALIAVAALFALGTKLAGGRPLAAQWVAVGHWTLWFGAMAALLAAATGWFAFNNVNHDEAGHAAMLLHRAWALPTVVGIGFLAIWAALRARSMASWLFVALLWSACAAVAVTSWLGGELVYRHGLGVMALPQADTGTAHDHAHSSHHHEHGTEAEEH
jgi:uncharacterized membrane protein